MQFFARRDDMKMKTIPSSSDDDSYDKIREIIIADDEKNLSQCKKLLLALRQRSISTVEARKHLFIMAVASRIMELKEQGHNIVTTRIGLKKVARYFLFAKKSDHDE